MQWKKRHNEFCKFRHGARLLANVVVGVNYRSFGVLSMSLDILANECFFFFYISRFMEYTSHSIEGYLLRRLFFECKIFLR